MGDLTQNFDSSEFKCPCCGRSDMDAGFMYKLQKFREIYGKAFSPVHGGGFRCENYDGKKGAHTMGRAADPGIPREDMYRALQIAFNVGFTGIGMKQKDGNWQFHVDDLENSPKRPRPWVWTY